MGQHEHAAWGDWRVRWGESARDGEKGRINHCPAGRMDGLGADKEVSPTTAADRYGGLIGWRRGDRRFSDRQVVRALVGCDGLARTVKFLLLPRQLAPRSVPPRGAPRCPAPQGQDRCEEAKRFAHGGPRGYGKRSGRRGITTATRMSADLVSRDIGPQGPTSPPSSDLSRANPASPRDEASSGWGLLAENLAAFLIQTKSRILHLPVVRFRHRGRRRKPSWTTRGAPTLRIRGSDVRFSAHGLGRTMAAH